VIVFIFFEQNFAQTLRLYPKVLTHTTLIETFALFTFSILFSTDTVSKHHNHCNLSLKSTKYIRQHSLGLQGPYKGSCAKDKWLRGQSARQSGQHGHNPFIVPPRPIVTMRPQPFPPNRTYISLTIRHSPLSTHRDSRSHWNCKTPYIYIPPSTPPNTRCL